MPGTDPIFPPQGKPTPTLPVDPLLGQVLGGYRVTQVIGAGGMGLVYEAMHEQISRRAAVKVLREEVAADAEWSDRFLREAQALAALKNKNIVDIVNFGKLPDGRSWLMMEYLEGEDLRTHLDRVGQLSPAVALQIIDQVLNGLAAAHKAGVVHRDMKPENVRLQREHNGELSLKVVDFGLARLADHRPAAPVAEGVVANNASSLHAGTPGYLSPEQAMGLAVGPGADLYAVGIMLFEMLAGELPFDDANIAKVMRAHASEAPPRLGSKVSNLPEGLEELVTLLLHKDPLQRPHSADVTRVSVGRILKRLMSDATAVRVMPAAAAPIPLTVPANPRDVSTERVLRPLGPEQLAEPPRPGRRAAVVLVALVLLGGLGALLWPSGSPAVVAPPPPVAVVKPIALAPVEPPPVVPPPPAPAVEPAPPPKPVDDTELTPLPPKPPPTLPAVVAAEPKPVVAKPVEVIDGPCANLEAWRVPTLDQIDLMATRLRGKMAADGASEAEIQKAESSAKPVRAQVNGAKDGHTCLQASRALDAWMAQHGL